MNYDDDRELTNYIWNHYRQLMTDFECKVGGAILTREKMRLNPTMSPRIAARLGHIDDPEINSALTEGSDAYRLAVRQRVMATSPDEIFVNRCPSCQRVVQTPLARQCLWCGADWHERSP